MSRESTEESELAANDAEFIAALLLHQHRQDNALGLHHVTARQRGLLWYYNLTLLKLHQDHFKAAMAKGALDQIRSRIKRIVAEAKKRSTPLERKRELLIEAMQLEEKAKQWPI